MIEFRQKEFAAKEYDAMKSLYNELMRNDLWRRKIRVIDSTSLLPILRGNNIVIERFVISTQFGKKDKFRMYLKIGAKAKMPEDVRLPGRPKYNKLFNSNLSFNGGGWFNKKISTGTTTNNEKQGTFSAISEEKTFSKNKKNNNNNNGGGNDINGRLDLGSVEVNYETTVPQGETLLYDKKSRTLVLEFDEIKDAIAALNILPFGLNYNIYLLDV